MIGRITFYNRDRGFGFIKSDTESYFFHHSNFKGVDDEPNILGALVYFLIGEPLSVGKRAQAIKIRFVTAEDVSGLEAVKVGV